MKAQSLLQVIRALGGVNVREIRDLTGEQRAVGANGAGLFRKPGAGNKSGLKVRGYGLDEMIEKLRGQGFHIPADDVDGGLEYLRDMIRLELDGTKVYSAEDQAAIWEAQREDREQRAMECRRKSRLLELAQQYREERRAQRKAA